MNSKKGIVINAAIIGAIIIGFLIINFFTSTPAPKMLSFENVGLQTPLKILNGDPSKTTSLKAYQGQNILIHFWASWCEACAADQKVMNQLAKSYESNSSIKILGIASSDTSQAIEKSGVIKESRYPQFLDESGDLALAMGVKSLPQTLLIDSKGQIIAQITRPFDPNLVDRLENQINTLSESYLPTFSLEKSSGKLLTDADLSQKVWVADFIFTSCPSLCPMLTNKMHLLQEAFKKDDRFRMVSVSVDPDTDTPSVMKAYEKKHDIDPEKWYFLRGKTDAVTNLLVRGFKLGTMEKPEFHTGKIVLVGQHNKVFGYYDADNSQSFEKLKTDISNLLK